MKTQGMWGQSKRLTKNEKENSDAEKEEEGTRERTKGRKRGNHIQSFTNGTILLLL